MMHAMGVAVRRRRRRRGGAGRAVGFVLVAFGVAQCSSLPDYANPIEWYRDASGLSQHDDHGQQRNSENLESGGKEPYPNLGSMPATPDRAMSTIDRQNLARGLATDRAQAKDTDAQLRAAEPAPQPGQVGPPTVITPPRRADASKAHPEAETDKGKPPAKSAAAAGSVRQHGSSGKESAPRESALVSPTVRSVPSGDTPQEPPPPPNIPPPSAARAPAASQPAASQAHEATPAPASEPVATPPSSSSPTAVAAPSPGARLSPSSDDAKTSAEQMATAEPRPAPPPPTIPPPEAFASPSIPQLAEPQPLAAPAAPPADASSPPLATAIPPETASPVPSASPGERPKPDDADRTPQPAPPPEQVATGAPPPAPPPEQVAADAPPPAAAIPAAPTGAPTALAEPEAAPVAPPSTDSATPPSDQAARVEPAQSAPSPVPIVPPADSARASSEQIAALPPADTSAAAPASQPGAAPGGSRSDKVPTISVQVAEIEFAASGVALTGDDDRRLADTMKLYEKHGGTIRVVGYGRRGYGPDAAQQELASFSKAIDRANVVAQALTKLGLPSNRIIVQAAPVGDGLGEDRAEILLEF
jgi:outer membrane protein OmpA-like peptidoglycan-associated protein